jgi:hypothetical protein
MINVHVIVVGETTLTLVPSIAGLPVRVSLTSAPVWKYVPVISTDETVVPEIPESGFVFLMVGAGAPVGVGEVVAVVVCMAVVDTVVGVLTGTDDRLTLESFLEYTLSTTFRPLVSVAVSVR